MSIMGIHFHGDIVTPLVEYLVDACVATAQYAHTKAPSGKREAAEHRYHEAVKNMALIRKYLTPEQKEIFQTSLSRYVIWHSTLLHQTEMFRRPA